MDYGYLLEGAEAEGSMPLWCAKDTRRWFCGAVVPTKGIEHPYNVQEVHPYNVQEVKRQILAGGLTKVILRSDGEHPILALKARAGEELRREGVEVIMSEASKGNSSGNGLAEHASSATSRGDAQRDVGAI
eukprot:5129352-Amphidinium_carterae.1